MSDAARKKQFETLVGPLAPDLFRYAYWLARDRQLAEDVVQETMIRAWKSLDKLRDAGSVKHWLFTIVRREHARTAADRACHGRGPRRPSPDSSPCVRDSRLGRARTGLRRALRSGADA